VFVLPEQPLPISNFAINSLPTIYLSIYMFYTYTRTYRGTTAGRVDETRTRKYIFRRGWFFVLISVPTAAGPVNRNPRRVEYGYAYNNTMLRTTVFTESSRKRHYTLQNGVTRRRTSRVRGNVQFRSSENVRVFSPISAAIPDYDVKNIVRIRPRSSCLRV